MQEKKKFKILIMGAGAVGGSFGARLAQNKSNDVFFVARGKHLDAINRKGLSIKSGEGNFNLRIKASENPQDYKETPDLILLTVKSYDTDDAIEKIKPKLFKTTQILSLQNGIENYFRLADAFGENNVVRGFCGIAAEVIEPGIISTSPGEVIIGGNNGNISERIRSLQGVFEASNIKCKVSGNIERDVWLKFTWNCIFNIVTAITGKTVDTIFENPDSIQLCRNIFSEIRSIARIQKVELNSEDEIKIVDSSKELGAFKTSTLQDRLKGRKLEYDAFTGAIIRLAERNRIEVPVNKTLYGLLKCVNDKM